MSLLPLLLLDLPSLCIGQQCVDKTHFFYNCDQLKQYCSVPQAVAIREKCPVTCNSCSERNQLGPTSETTSYTNDPVNVGPPTASPTTPALANNPTDLREKPVGKYGGVSIFDPIRNG